MASKTLSSGNGNAVRYQQTLDLVIGNFHKTQKQTGMCLQASAFNEELKPYGDELRQSRWVLSVERPVGQHNKCLVAYVALEGSGNIQFKVEKTALRIISMKGETLFSDDVHALEACSFTGVKPLSVKDYKYKCIGWISYDELAKSPLYTEGDELRVRAEIKFTVISGGTLPAAPLTNPANLLDSGTAAAGPSADEYIMKSCDGRRFRIKKLLVRGIPYFDGIVKAIENPEDGFTFCQDGETLEFIFDFLNLKRVQHPELNKKILMAADIFGLKAIQLEAMKPLVKDLTIEKASDAFKLAAENNIACLRAKIVSLIPTLPEKVTVANAAKALILAAQADYPVLQKTALDAISPDVTEFFLADGFEQISSVPGLVTEVKKAVAKYRAEKMQDGSQDQTPAKKLKPTSSMQREWLDRLHEKDYF